MLKKITMPAGGQNTDQLLIAKWRKSVGDPVKRGDILLDVETDKAVLEVESFAQGTLLKLLFEEGDYAGVGDVIAYVGELGDLKALEEKKEEPVVQQAELPVDDFTPIMPLTESVPVGEGVTEVARKISPAAKKLIRDHHLDSTLIYSISGGDIIHKRDIESYISGIAEVMSAPSAAADLTQEQTRDFDLIPLTNIRKIIAARMLQSTSSIPSFTAEVEVDMGACVQLRDQINQKTEGLKISFNDIIAKCFAKCVETYPLINASYTDDGLKVFKSVNAGLAVSLEQGLIVPVVRNVAGKTLSVLARENQANIKDVRSGKFDPAIMEGGTFTISNLGKYPICRFTAIINPPQSCIIAVGSIRMQPVWEDGQWQPRQIMSITATFDHRIIDGAYGAHFLTRLKELLENPYLLLV